MTMHGYKDFPKDAKEVFKDVIDEFKLKVIFESPTEIIFKSNKCVIGLFTEYNYVQLSFKENEEAKWMFLGPYLEARYPGEKIIIRQPQENLGRIEKIRFSLDEELEFVKKYCLPILSGDFSWKERYNL